MYFVCIRSSDAGYIAAIGLHGHDIGYAGKVGWSAACNFTIGTSSLYQKEKTIS